MNTQQYFYSLRSGKDREKDSLYTRASNAVFRGGYQTMNELCAATEADL